MGGNDRRGALTAATAAAVAVALLLLAPRPAGADGTEALGPPSIVVADGDTLVGNGVGLFGTEPAGPDPGGSRPVVLDVPAAAAVRQVLVYWEGQSSGPGGGDSTVLVDGVEVTGHLIGGPSAVGSVFTQTYRADVTSLGVLSPGPNTVSIGGLAFDLKNSGAGIVAVLDTGQPAALAMVDGNDFAFFRFAPPFDATTPVTMSFPTTTEATIGTPLLFVSSVDDERPRSSVIRFTFDTGDVVEFTDVLRNSDGDEWDTFDEPVPVPAGASSVTLEILSELPPGQDEGPLPASLVLNLAALSVPQPAQVGGLQVVKSISGATEGYVDGTAFTVAVDCDGDAFDTVVEVTPGAPPASVTGIPSGTSCTVRETVMPEPAADHVYGTPTYTPSDTVVVAAGSTVEVVIDNPLTERTIAVTATAQCIDDTPYVDYDVALGTGVDAPEGVTIRFRNTSTGGIEQELTAQPMAGRLLWPGAEVDAEGRPVDWPGWELIDGAWIEVDDGLRPEIDVEIEVNPTDAVRIDYPPPLPTCNPNPGGGLQVSKVVADDGAGHAAGTVFGFTLSCSDATFDEVFSLADGETFTTEGLPIGTACTVTETALPDPVAGWSWAEPAYSPGPTVVVDDTAGLVGVVVTNSASERQTPALPDRPAVPDTPTIPDTGAESADAGLLGLVLVTLGGALLVLARIIGRSVT